MELGAFGLGAKQTRAVAEDFAVRNKAASQLVSRITPLVEFELREYMLSNIRIYSMELGFRQGDAG